MDSASGPGFLAVLRWCGRRVGSLGPGLTSESADAARAVLRDDRRPGPGSSWHPPACRSDLPVLGKRPGFTGPAASGCVPPPQPEKRDGMTIVEDRRAITGGVDTHADTHVAAALDPIGGLLGVQEFPATAAGYARPAGLAGRVRDRRPGRDRGHRQLRRRPGPPRHRGRGPGRGGGPLRPPGPPPAGQVRPAGRRQRRPGRPVGPGPRRAQGPRRRGGGDPGADGRQAQRPRRADPDHQPGPGTGPDRPR